MNSSKLLSVFVCSAILSLAVPAFADKIGVVFEGDADIQKSISEALVKDGKEVVDVTENAKDIKLDSVAAATIGKATQTSIIVSGKKLGKIIILKVLSTKNDTVVGGTVESADGVVEQVKKILTENKEKFAE